MIDSVSLSSLSPGSLLGAAVTADAPARTLVDKFIAGGGVIGWIIVALSITAVVLIVVHFVTIRRAKLLPADQIDRLRELLGQGQAQPALEYCLQAEHDSYLTRILAPGLTRFIRSPFGVFEVKTAIEDAGAEQTARLYRATDALGVIGSIAPLLGLLGTVQGMIGAFDVVAASSGADSAYYEQLAANISLALVTTMQGLVVAIPCVALFTFFRNRIDAIAADAGTELDHLAMLLESARPANAPGQRAAAPPPPPPPTPAGGARR